MLREIALQNKHPPPGMYDRMYVLHRSSIVVCNMGNEREMLKFLTDLGVICYVVQSKTKHGIGFVHTGSMGEM